MNNTFDIKKQLGSRIKELRKERNFTQEKFAELINIEPQSLSNIERGKFAPSIETLQKIANVLEVQPYELYLFEQIEPLEQIRKTLVSAIEHNDIVALRLYKYYLKDM